MGVKQNTAGQLAKIAVAELKIADSIIQDKVREVMSELADFAYANDLPDAEIRIEIKPRCSGMQRTFGTIMTARRFREQTGQDGFFHVKVPTG